MYYRIGRALCVLCLSTFVFCLVHLQAAAPAPFAGSYQLSDIVEDSSGVHVTMTLTLFNPGKSAVSNGIVALFDSTPHHTLIGSFLPIKLLNHSSQTTLVDRFTISAAEYARWKQGQPAGLKFLVQGQDGAVASEIQSHDITKPVAATN